MKQRMMIFALAAVAAVGCDQIGGPTVEPGDQVPSVTLQTAEGQQVSLADLPEQSPVVLVFYQGNWCRFSRQRLSGLKEAWPELQQMGYELVAVSPDTPSELRDTLGWLDPPYTLLSDAELQAARKFGVTVPVSPQTLRGFPSAEREEIRQRCVGTREDLIQPSAFVIGTDGQIRSARISRDPYTTLTAEDVLALAREQ